MRCPQCLRPRAKKEEQEKGPHVGGASKETQADQPGNQLIRMDITHVYIHAHVHTCRYIHTN